MFKQPLHLPPPPPPPPCVIQTKIKLQVYDNRLKYLTEFLKQYRTLCSKV